MKVVVFSSLNSICSKFSLFLVPELVVMFITIPSLSGQVLRLGKAKSLLSRETPLYCQFSAFL